MNRNALTLAALTATLTLAGGASAGGPHGGGHGHAGRSGGPAGRQSAYRGTVYSGSRTATGKTFFSGKAGQRVCYRGRDQSHWSYCRWSGRFGCWLYYCQADLCYYYWCPQDECYYPTDYCPYDKYEAGDRVNYAPRSVPVADDDN